MILKVSVLKHAMFAIFILTSLNMQAQNDSTKNQFLDKQQQSIAIIAALTAVGDSEQLVKQIIVGLDAGVTINEIKEELVQLYAYCGFPRSLNAINAFMKILEERKLKGITDKEGKQTSYHKASSDKYEQGRKVLEELTKTPQQKPAPGFGAFAPRIDAFLKEHLFADIFESDVLSYQYRELITISALAAMPGVEAQLQAHIKIGMNTGITEDQLMELSNLIEKHISRTQANTIRKCISKPVEPIIQPDIIVRISELEIFPEHLEEYKSILKEESSASVKIEPGVISIFPMVQKEDSTQFRIVEIYANNAAYKSHLQTPHFQHYKTTTLKMVKSLKLVDMKTLDELTTLELFKKLK